MSGRKLAIKSQATRGHASPDAQSPTVLSLGDEDGFDGDAIVGASRLMACKGSWVQTHPRAWVDRVCGVQETPCEGQGGDPAPR